MEQENALTFLLHNHFTHARTLFVYITHSKTVRESEINITFLYSHIHIHNKGEPFQRCHTPFHLMRNETAQTHTFSLF